MGSSTPGTVAIPHDCTVAATPSASAEFNQAYSAAFELLIRHSECYFRTRCGCNRDATEEASRHVVGQVYFEGHAAVGNGAVVANWIGWFIARLRLRCRDQARKLRHRHARERPLNAAGEPEACGQDPVTEAVAGEEEYERRELTRRRAEVVIRLIQELPAEQRCIWDYYRRGSTASEAARSMGLTEPAYKGRLKRLLKWLRKQVVEAVPDGLAG
jgi:DNA-directed RNA polymerase specialized sigma24 family protein